MSVRLAVSLTLQFEAGGQPIGGAPGPITDPILPGFPDLAQNSFYEYGPREGVPRLLDLFDKHGIVVSAYDIDDLSADEPFLQTINGRPFVTVPYTAHLNDLASFDFPGFDPAAYEQQLIDEFEQLYEEGARRRRLMVVALHDRVSGHASRVRVAWAEHAPAPVSGLPGSSA